MHTESVIDSREVARTAACSLVRTLDLDALAAEHGESIPRSALETAGTFAVLVQPVRRGAEARRIDVDSLDVGRAFLDGFALCAELKARTRRGAKNGKRAKK